jgi:hypothetical protein
LLWAWMSMEKRLWQTKPESTTKSRIAFWLELDGVLYPALSCNFVLLLDKRGIRVVVWVEKRSSGDEAGENFVS